MQKQGQGQTRLEEDSEKNSAEEQGLGLKCRLYRLLLDKYSELITESERRTIGEIKGLVNSDDLTIQSLIADFKNADYSFEKAFLESAEKVFSFVSKEINFVELDFSLNYWLSPKEIFSEKVADDEDIAIFLCSLLLALGDENASIVVAELDNQQTHAFVITEFNEKFFILDACQKHSFHKFSGNRDRVLMNFSFRGAKIKQFLYKFNHSTYEQFVES